MCLLSSTDFYTHIFGQFPFINMPITDSIFTLNSKVQPILKIRLNRLLKNKIYELHFNVVHSSTNILSIHALRELGVTVDFAKQQLFVGNELIPQPTAYN